VIDMPTPTPREMEILKVLWEQGPSSVRTVYRLLSVDKDQRAAGKAYNTVQTLMRIMEDKGLVAHHAEGRTFVYKPCFSRDESAARYLDRVFDGAADQLVQSLLRSEKIPSDELDRLQAMIAEARRKRSKGG
jgi:BlaI family penicillinase repressor